MTNNPDDDDFPRRLSSEDLSKQANARGLAEGKYSTPRGILDVYAPNKLRSGSGWGIYSRIEEVTDSLCPLTWAEVVAESDRRNLDLSGIDKFPDPLNHSRMS